MKKLAESVFIAGAGQMGSGIAQVTVQAGYYVTLYDVSQKALEKARAKIEQSWGKLLAKEKITIRQAEQFAQNIQFSDTPVNAASAFLVIEAVNEDQQLKRQIFQELGGICSEKTIMASNTSSFSITCLAAAYKHSCNLIGLHFMNPVPVMELVEVIKGERTADWVYERAVQFVRELGKEPVTVQDYPGFVLNRLLLLMINEAVYGLMEGVAAAEDIDRVMKLGARHPMGPLALADLIGLDTCLAILETLYNGFGDPKYRPCPLLKRMVNAGYLGQKSGQGFFSY
ncbi:3-hydroxyacyl-CoA dehydrogenase NAD-binding domain-containing protein [Zhaonella formicivorans]|uniref:3-hydroxyacyl-CoA dehydrogenase family protein n=1 Tax=Zhaonella formicivorans TaxID=2528593 RepID=UPI0010EC97BA